MVAKATTKTPGFYLPAWQPLRKENISFLIVLTKVPGLTLLGPGLAHMPIAELITVSRRMQYSDWSNLNHSRNWGRRQSYLEWEWGRGSLPPKKRVLVPKRETGMDFRKTERIADLLQECSEQLCPGSSDSWQPSRALFQLGFLFEKGKRRNSLWPLTFLYKDLKPAPTGS